MEETQTRVRIELASQGTASVTTGLSVLDHLVGELARSARIQLVLEVAPGAADAAAVAAGRALGDELARMLRAPNASGRGWAWLPAEEALAGAVIEVSGHAHLASNVDFSGHRVGGLASDVVGRFLTEVAEGAGLNLHIRVLEGKDPEHVLTAIFKALGAALGQACRPPHEGRTP